MSHPPGLFDIGRLARAVSWASGPVKAGGRAVEVQMSTGTEKGHDVTLESLCGSKNLWKAKVSVDPKEGEGFEQRAERMPEWIEGRTSRLLLTISLDPTGNGKNPTGITVNSRNVWVSSEKGRNFIATGIWKYFACN